MKKLGELLDEVLCLQNSYAQLQKDKAYGFNIFSLLLKSGDEVNLHSKFIYDLLNPRGTHQQGSLFLKLFLKEIGLEHNADEFELFREKENIDILIQSSTYSIIIENKIYTTDHSEQLKRYWQSIKNQGYPESNILVVYLTLFGDEPLQKNLPFNVKTIAYRNEISSWLKRSLGVVHSIPVIHETILQYLQLVEQLTNQSKKKGFVMDVKNLLLKENNLQIILDIEASVIEAKIEIQLSFWQTLLAQLIPYYSFSFYNNNNDKGLKTSVCSYYQQQKNIKDYGIEYQIEDNLYFFIELRENIYYGFYFEDEISEKQKSALELLDVNWREVSNGIYWKYPQKRLNFKLFNHQNIFELINKESKEESVSKISREVISLVQNYKKEKLY